MGFFASKTLEHGCTPTLLDPRFDHDSCGVGFVATLRNIPSHEILTQALTALARLAHRGAIAADGKSSDGVGIMTAIPREFLLTSTGVSLDAGQPLAVGVVFFPSESSAGQQALEQALAAQKLFASADARMPVPDSAPVPELVVRESTGPVRSP